MYPRTLLLIVFLSVSRWGTAQTQERPGRFWDVIRTHMEFGLHGGMSGYMGELNNQLGQLNDWTFGGGAKYYFDRIDKRSRTWGLRLDYNLLNIQADDRKSSNLADVERNLHFTNRIHELAAAAEFHFWKFRPNRSRHMMTPYVFAGVGVIRHHPKTEDGISLIEAMVEPGKITRSTTDNEVTKTTLQPKYVMSIPVGVGFKYNLSRSWAPVSVGLELNGRFPMSDFLDGVGRGKYLSYDDAFANANISDRFVQDQTEWEELAGPQIMVTGTPYADLIDRPRGNPGSDFFMTATFRITYTLYKWRDPLWK